jgi:hypothetical protein
VAKVRDGWLLGVDPAAEGAMTLLSEPTQAVAAFHWKKHTVDGRSVFKLNIATVDGDRVSHDGLTGAWAIGLTCLRFMEQRGLIMLAGAMRVAAEEAIVVQNPNTTVKIAKFGGAVVSAVERWDPTGEALWVRPPVWQRMMFGPVKRGGTKPASLGLMPARIKGLGALLAVLGDHDHITDAAGIAAWRGLHR